MAMSKRAYRVASHLGLNVRQGTMESAWRRAVLLKSPFHDYYARSMNIIPSIELACPLGLRSRSPLLCMYLSNECFPPSVPAAEQA